MTLDYPDMDPSVPPPSINAGATPLNLAHTGKILDEKLCAILKSIWIE